MFEWIVAVFAVNTAAYVCVLILGEMRTRRALKELKADIEREAHWFDEVITELNEGLDEAEKTIEHLQEYMQHQQDEIEKLKLKQKQ
jgi:peptidoglycan hydrolase CwlO-like protein